MIPLKTGYPSSSNASTIKAPDIKHASLHRPGRSVSNPPTVLASHAHDPLALNADTLAQRESRSISSPPAVPLRAGASHVSSLQLSSRSTSTLQPGHSMPMQETPVTMPRVSQEYSDLDEEHEQYSKEGPSNAHVGPTREVDGLRLHVYPPFDLFFVNLKTCRLMDAIKSSANLVSTR